MNNLQKRQQSLPDVKKCCQPPDTSNLANEVVGQFILNAWSNSHMTSDKDFEKVAEAKASYDFHLESVVELMAMEDHDDQFDALEGMVLSLDQRRTFDICFGTGGPAYHLIINTGSGPGADIISMSFEYHDWFYKKVFPIVHGTDDWDNWYDFVMTFYDPNEIGELL
jgi:hypothetical protein